MFLRRKLMGRKCQKLSRVRLWEGPWHWATLSSQVTGMWKGEDPNSPVNTGLNLTPASTKHIYPYAPRRFLNHSSQAPSPNKPQVLGCPDQPGKRAWKVWHQRQGMSKMGELEDKYQGWYKFRICNAGDWRDFSPGTKATRQTWRRDEPQNEDSYYSGSGGQDDHCGLLPLTLKSGGLR